jgi:drug/metabolite transporter superfamily protein YnfA
MDISRLQRMRRFRMTRTGRGLWLALALLVLTVQTALPAHEESHHLGRADVLCQYCVLGGLFSLTSSMPPVVIPQVWDIAPQTVFLSFTFATLPRTRFSRGPPSTSTV